MLVGEMVNDPKLGPSESIFELLTTVSTSCWVGYWLTKLFVSQNLNPFNEYIPGVLAEGSNTTVAVNSPSCKVPLESSHPPRPAVELGLPPEKTVLLPKIIPASIPVVSLAWRVTVTVTDPVVISMLVGEMVNDPKLGPSKSGKDVVVFVEETVNDPLNVAEAVPAVLLAVSV